MDVLDLFSGIGGFSLGLERSGMNTIAFCEVDPYCQKVLKKHWPNVPIHEDIRKLDGKQYQGHIDVVCGGFPCQPYSAAGQQRGSEDDRHLWPEMLRIIQEARPSWVIAENVANFKNMGLDQALSDLEAAGYSTGALIIPACAVGAPHRRDRIWIIANSYSLRLEGPRAQKQATRATRGAKEPKRKNIEQGESRLPRFIDGLSSRVDKFVWRNRIQTIGNSVYPEIPQIIGEAIVEQWLRKHSDPEA